MAKIIKIKINKKKILKKFQFLSSKEEEALKCLIHLL